MASLNFQDRAQWDHEPSPTKLCCMCNKVLYTPFAEFHSEANDGNKMPELVKVPRALPDMFQHG